MTSVKVSKLLPSTLPSPPAALALPITAALVELLTQGALATVGRVMARTASITQGALPTPNDVRRALAPLVSLRALRWCSDGTAQALCLPTVRRELERLRVVYARQRAQCCECAKGGQRGRMFWQTGRCKGCRLTVR